MLRSEACRYETAASLSVLEDEASATREKLEVLARLLEDGTEKDQLMRAEVLRELGRFEEAGKR